MKNNMDFIAWLQVQVKQEGFDVKEGALVRFVTDGVFLPSPSVFRAYSQHRWAEVQHDFLLRKMHVHCPDTNSHFQYHRYQVGVLIPYENLNRLLPDLPLPLSIGKQSCG